jgi:hypothetical protein
LNFLFYRRSSVTDITLSFQKILEELERQAVEASQRASQAAGDKEEDSKEDVLERASKRLKIAKEEDGGYVDLTVQQAHSCDSADSFADAEPMSCQVEAS